MVPCPRPLPAIVSRRLPSPLAARLIALRSALALALILAPALATPALAAPPPELRSLTPPALAPGSTTTLRIRTRHLGTNALLWTTWLPHPIALPVEASSPASPDADHDLDVRIHIPDSLPPGFEWIRLTSASGVARPRIVLIDPLPARAFEPNPQPLDLPDLPLAFDATYRPGKIHRLRFQLDQGQALGFETIAHRLGSEADPVLRIRDPSGRELAYANDTPGLGFDSALRFVAPHAGVFTLETHDSDHAGGGAHAFRLRIGTFPNAVVSWPPGLLPAAPRPVAWISMSDPARRGDGLLHHLEPRSNLGRFPVDPPRLPASLPTSPSNPAPAETGAVLTPRLELPALPTAREIEPNNSRLTAQAIDPSHAIAATFDARADTDWYRFEIPAPGRWRFRARARSLGLPTDPLLILCSADGSVIDRSSGDALDPELRHTFKEPGTFLLIVQEAGDRHGPGRGYLLDLDPADPGFEISAETDSLALPSGTNAILKIRIQRLGEDGAIRFELDDAPAGFTLAHAEAGPGKKDWDLEFQADPQLVPGTAAPVRLIARSMTSTPANPAPAVSLDLRPALRKSFPKLLVPPPGFPHRLWLVVTPAPPTP